MQTKTGILLPRSDMYPTLALDFLNGFRLALAERGKPVDEPKLFIESIVNASDDTVLKTAEKMILQEDVDLTIAFCSIFKLKELVTLFSSYKKNLIHLDLGGNVLRDEHVSPFVIHHTLNLWQSAYRAGEYAARELGKKAAVCTSFYDGGYHLLESFARGFTANGGTIVFSYVAPFDYKAETYDKLIEGIEKSEPDLVFSLFSYKEESKVLEILSKKLNNKALPIFWSPLINTQHENTESFALHNIYTLSSWNFGNQNTAMQHFNAAYTTEFSASPNPISLLGFETGLTFVHLLNDQAKLPAAIGTYSSNLKIESPRGELTFNNFHESQSSEYLIGNYDFSGDQNTCTIVQKLRKNGEDKLYSLLNGLPQSGWQNPYIIT